MRSIRLKLREKTIPDRCLFPQMHSRSFQCILELGQSESRVKGLVARFGTKNVAITLSHLHNPRNNDHCKRQSFCDRKK